MLSRRSLLLSGAAACLASRASSARAANAPGVTDAEIKIGQTMPYSGPASSYGVIGKTEAAYFKMINEKGGVNGRKLTLVSLDDGYSPSKTLEQTRRLVEQDQVALIFGSFGTAPNAATRSYLNENQVPQLLVASGAGMWNDPRHFPWSSSFFPHYRNEARIYIRRILAANPDARIGLLYQNDDFGRDYRLGLGDEIAGRRAGAIVAELSYETSEPTLDSQVVALQAAGADALILAATIKFAALAIRKAADIGWSPDRYLSDASAAVVNVLGTSVRETSKGLVTACYVKLPTDARWRDDAGMKEWLDFATQRLRPAQINDINAIGGYCTSSILVQILRQCGDDLSRANIMRQAANLRDLTLPLLLPGVTINTTPDDFSAIRRAQLARFDGDNWNLFGDLIEV